MWPKVILNNTNKSSKNIRLLVALLLFLYPFFGGSQTYSFRPSADYSFIAGGAISLMVGQALAHNTSGLTTSEISLLQPNDINNLDRNAIHNYSHAAATASDVLLVASGVAASSLLLDKTIRNQWLTIGVMGVEMFTLTAGLTTVIKGVTLRTRPYAYNQVVPLADRQQVDARFSFFSGHTALSAGVTFFGAKVYADTHPNSRWKPVVWTLAAVIPAATGVARVQAGQHFITDVMAGYAFGALVGILIPQMHLMKQNEKASLNVTPTWNGLALKMVW